MRMLRITRRKALAACAMKLKLYIEDPAGDTTIRGTLCRMLGTLKNGETGAFPISEREAKLYVAGDRISRNLYHEVWPIPQGTEDIALAGRNYLNPFAGNPFRFDGAAGELTLSNRKRLKRSGALLVVASALAGALIGSGVLGRLFDQGPKTFREQDLSITLTRAYEREYVEGFSGAYVSDDGMVLLLEEPFSLAEGFGDLSLEEYMECVLLGNPNAAGGELGQTEGMLTLTYDYTNPENGMAYTYLVVPYKSADAFWLVQFVTTAGQAEDMRPRFVEFAKTVGFGE